MSRAASGSKRSHGEILVGTASWTDRTLLDSGWYPKDAKTAEKRLAYYASQFNVVEVDSTYYAPPSERNSALWVERTPVDFTFNIKAFSLLTGHPTKSDALYKDLPKPDKKNIYTDDLDGKIIDEVWDDGYTGASNIVDTYVGYLRRKLGAHGPNLIQTQRGFGYALREDGPR